MIVSFFSLQILLIIRSLVILCRLYLSVLTLPPRTSIPPFFLEYREEWTGFQSCFPTSLSPSRIPSSVFFKLDLALRKVPQPQVAARGKLQSMMHFYLLFLPSAQALLSFFRFVWGPCPFFSSILRVVRLIEFVFQASPTFSPCFLDFRVMLAERAGSADLRARTLAALVFPSREVASARFFLFMEIIDVVDPLLPAGSSRCKLMFLISVDACSLTTYRAWYIATQFLRAYHWNNHRTSAFVFVDNHSDHRYLLFLFLFFSCVKPWAAHRFPCGIGTPLAIFFSFCIHLFFSDTAGCKRC